MRYLILLSTLLLSTPLLAQEDPHDPIPDHGTKQEAVSLVRSALDHIETAGLEQALEDFRQPDNEFVDRDLYVFVYDFEGNNLVNTAPLELTGANLKDYRSEDGKLVIQQMIEMSRSHGGGAFEYHWINPVTGEVQSKISYFRKIPGFPGFVGSGYYKGAEE